MTIKNVQDAVRIKGSSQLTLATSGTATQLTSIPEGIYAIWNDGVDIYLKHMDEGGTATDVSVSNGYILKAGVTDTIEINHNDVLGAVAAGSANLYLHKINVL